MCGSGCKHGPQTQGPTQQDSLQSQQDAQTSVEAWKELRSGEKEGVTDMWVKVMARIKLKQEFEIAQPQETHTYWHWTHKP